MKRLEQPVKAHSSAVNRQRKEHRRRRCGATQHDGVHHVPVRLLFAYRHPEGKRTRVLAKAHRN